MFGMQDNYWIWILLAFFLLFGNEGCGIDFNLGKLGNMFGCGNNSMLIIAAVAAFFFLQSSGMVC